MPEQVYKEQQAQVEGACVKNSDCVFNTGVADNAGVAFGNQCGKQEQRENNREIREEQISFNLREIEVKAKQESEEEGANESNEVQAYNNPPWKNGQT